MSIFAWLLMGLLAGFIGSKIVTSNGQGIFADIVIGMLGALVGGFLFNLFGTVGMTGFNLWSLIVATIGSVVLLAVYYAIRGTLWRRPPL